MIIEHNLSLDNDKPSVSSSVANLVESSHNVVLTCAPSTVDTVIGYQWFKDNQRITSASSNTYSLPGNTRASSGSYSCKVSTRNAPLSALAQATPVTFLCKTYSLNIIS